MDRLHCNEQIKECKAKCVCLRGYKTLKCLPFVSNYARQLEVTTFPINMPSCSQIC